VIGLAACVAVAGPAAARERPHAAAAQVRTDHSCYLVGQTVAVTGTGFDASSLYDIDIDGVDFGQSTTSATGGFSSSLAPGGLAAGQVQTVDQLDASDGTNEATTTFTVTRAIGAVFGGGASLTAKAPFRVWDFTPGGAPVTVYLHYVLAGRPAVRTIELGRTSGQ
jgi:hypothetical protein